MNLFKLGLAIYFSTVVSAFANCELSSNGYHTIAKYGEKEGTHQKYSYVPFIFNDPYYLVKTNFKNFYHHDEESFDIEPKSISYGADQSCFDLKSVQKLSNKSFGSTYTRIKTCDRYVPLIAPQQGWAMYEYETAKLAFPIHIKAIPFTEISEISKKIESSIEKYLVGRSFKASKKIILPKGTFKPKKYDHFKFNEYFFSTTVKVEHTSLKSFYAVFLTFKDSTWYIADSGGLDHCEDEPTLDKISGADLGWIANMKSGWDYNGDGLPEIINFEEPDTFYFMDFGKDLFVIKATDSRVSMSYGNFMEGLGFISDQP